MEKISSCNSFHQGEVVQLALCIPYSYGAESSETQECTPLSVFVHLSVQLSSVSVPFIKGTAGGRVDDGWAEDELEQGLLIIHSCTRTRQMVTKSFQFIQRLSQKAISHALREPFSGSGGHQFVATGGQSNGEGRSTQNWLKGVISSKLHLRLGDLRSTNKLQAGSLHLSFLRIAMASLRGKILYSFFWKGKVSLTEGNPHGRLFSSSRSQIFLLFTAAAIDSGPNPCTRVPCRRILKNNSPEVQPG